MIMHIFLYAQIVSDTSILQGFLVSYFIGKGGQ